MKCQTALFSKHMRLHVLAVFISTAGEHHGLLAEDRRASPYGAPAPAPVLPPAGFVLRLETHVCFRFHLSPRLHPPCCMCLPPPPPCYGLKKEPIPSAQIYAPTRRSRGAQTVCARARALIVCVCAGAGPFTPTPPPLLGFGPEVPDHGRRWRPKEILLDLVEGEKMGFHPMCLCSKYSVF